MGSQWLILNDRLRSCSRIWWIHNFSSRDSIDGRCLMGERTVILSNPQMLNLITIWWILDLKMQCIKILSESSFKQSENSQFFPHIYILNVSTFFWRKHWKYWCLYLFLFHVLNSSECCGVTWMQPVDFSGYQKYFKINSLQWLLTFWKVVCNPHLHPDPPLENQCAKVHGT